VGVGAAWNWVSVAPYSLRSRIFDETELAVVESGAVSIRKSTADHTMSARYLLNFVSN
jgi:hypothetical protein